MSKVQLAVFAFPPKYSLPSSAPPPRWISWSRVGLLQHQHIARSTRALGLPNPERAPSPSPKTCPSSSSPTEDRNTAWIQAAPNTEPPSNWGKSAVSVQNGSPQLERLSPSAFPHLRPLRPSRPVRAPRRPSHPEPAALTSLSVRFFSGPSR